MVNKKILLSIIAISTILSGCAKESTLLGMMGSIQSIDSFVEGKDSTGSIAFGGDTSSVNDFLAKRKAKKFEESLKAETSYFGGAIRLYFNETIEVQDIYIEYFGAHPQTYVKAHGLQFSMKDGKYIVGRNIQSLEFTCYDSEGKVNAGQSMYITIKIKKEDVAFTKKVYMSPI